MPLDGFTLYAVKTELENKLIDSRIEKIMQPEKDEINIVFRKNKENHKLIISSSPNFPRVCLTKSFDKENPIKAPIFLMVLRKHILSGKVLSINQKNMDRILNIDILVLNEFKEEIVKSLYIEIMGKHSNIILVNKLENKIIDSIKRIPMSVSSYRQVLPNFDYISPPTQNKINPLEISEKNLFMEKILSQKNSVFKSIYMSFYGISPVLAKEICFRTDIENKMLVANLKEKQITDLFDCFTNIMNIAKKKNFQPNVIIDELNDKILDFGALNFNIYKNDFKMISCDNCNEACDKYFSLKDQKDRIKQKTHDIRKIIANKISVNKNKIEKQSIEYNLTENMDTYKHNADLLTSYIYLINSGDDKIIVNDFYKEGNPEIEISLDENLTPSENIQFLYKKYNKLKNRKKELNVQIKNTKEELNYLHNLEQSIENISNINDLDEIIEEMKNQNLLKKKSNNKKNKNHKSKPIHYISSDGSDIYIGKNNTQNDYLTLKFANKEDIWMHVKDAPGSHVIIKDNKHISNQTLFEAANLAGYYSKMKNSTNIPIDYTEKKNVKKPNAAKPGMVIYLTNSTLYITPDKKIINSLKKIED